MASADDRSALQQLVSIDKHTDLVVGSMAAASTPNDLHTPPLSPTSPLVAFLEASLEGQMRKAGEMALDEAHFAAQDRRCPTPPMTVLLPDLFASFLSIPPKLHPEYERAKKESEEYFLDVMRWDEKSHKRHCRGDFAYFAAIFCTDASYDDFRIIVDWCNWVFPFDDQFDEDGCCRNNLEMANAELVANESLMGPNPAPHNKEDFPLRYIMHDICQRISRSTTCAIEERVHKGFSMYYSGVMKQVALDHSPTTEITDEEFLKQRRETIGVYPVLYLILFWQNLELPDYVFEDAAIKEIENLTADIIVLQNEILSYQKEYHNGDDRNLVARLRKSGLSQQQAYDRVNMLLKGCYKRWYIAHSEVPCWGEKIDSRVQRYLKGCADLCIANLDWSFRTKRYFGAANDFVRRTREVDYLP